MSNIRNSGTILVFLGAVFWSLNAPLVKFLTADPLLICGLRSIIAGITLMPFIRWKRLNWTPWMVVYISSYCALCISIILALAKTSAAIAIGMQYTATIWLFLANLIITRKFNKKAFWPVCVIFAGVIFFMCSGTDNSSSSGNMIALLEGIFFAFMSVGAKKSAGTNPLGLTAIANLSLRPFPPQRAIWERCLQATGRCCSFSVSSKLGPDMAFTTWEFRRFQLKRPPSSHSGR